MDVWLLWCIFIVVLAMCEYAILLTIRYGRMNKIGNKDSDKAIREKKCQKIDRCAIIVFMAINILVICTYFYVWN